VKRKTWVAAAAAVLVVVSGAVVTSGAEQATPAAVGAPANTARVVKGELSSMVSLDGTLTHRARSDGSPYPAINQARGIYTKLPVEGDKLDCGDVLYRVDDDPVLLLCGTVPAYRDLRTSDRGKDARQLTRNLRALGYDSLKALQRDKGLRRTGTLALGDAVFLPGSMRISKVSGKVGGSARPGAEVAQATSDALEVQVNLEASQQGEVKVGDRAQITLPGNRSVMGKVNRLGKVARTAEEGDDVGNATIPAYVSLDKPAEARGLDRAPVQVDITTTGVPSALSVPVTALVGKSGGGFAVEVVREHGRRRLVAVKLGLFDTANGRVQVEGELDEGDQVVVPSL
jgi:hypothetical protein